MTTSLAELIGATNPGEDTRLRQATVVAAPAGGVCTIRFGGSDTADNISGVRMLASASAVNGDSVWVLQTGGALLILGKLNLGGPDGSTTISPGIELYHPTSTPYIDFHAGANPAGDSNADYKSRIIMQSTGRLDFGITGSGGPYTFLMWPDGEFDCHHLGVNGDNVANIGISVDAGNVLIQGTAGRNYFKDSEFSTGAGLRVGAAWGKYGIYAESGDVIIGGASGLSSIQNGVLTANGTGVQTWNYPIILSAVANDTTHRVYHDTVGVDGPHISGYAGVQFLFASGTGTLQWDNTGQLFTNYGCGLDGAWVLQSRYAGAATGGALLTKGGGNRVRFDWTAGAFQMWVDVSNVKTFVIPHPVQDDRWLVHGTLEGPEAGVYYRGQAQLDGGWAEVALPDYFEALCETDGRSVMLTCIADDPEDEWCPVLHATYPKGGRFFVGLGSGMVIPDQRFWWEVKAVRRGVPLDVEPLRRNVDVRGDGPYTYIERKT